MVFQSSTSFGKCLVTIRYGDYIERRAAGAGPEDASCHQILEDKQWGMWQDVDWLPPSFAEYKGNLSRQRGHSFQHTPDCSLCIHMHTHRHSHERACSRAGPFHLTALSGREGIYSQWQWHSVVLLEMELSPSNLRHCRELAHIKPCVLWPSCLTSGGEKLRDPGMKPSIQPHAKWCFLYLDLLNELAVLYLSTSQCSCAEPD